MKKTLSNLLTTRYLMIIRSEENFAEKKTLRFNLAQIVLILSSVFIFLAITSFYLSVTLLAAWFDPRAVELEANRQVINLSLSVDSLIYEVQKKDNFINNIKMILGGGEAADGLDDLKNSRQAVGQVTSADTLQDIDLMFRRQFEDIGFDIYGVRNEVSGELQDIYFFQPIDNGIISDGFSPIKGHYGIDIVAKKDEPVKTVADGTVIFASWTRDTGYVIAVQHRSNLISVYKHNSDLLKNVGSFVSAGEIISIIGNTGELTSGPHLHLELWYNGNPLNPSEFLSY